MDGIQFGLCQVPNMNQVKGILNKDNSDIARMEHFIALPHANLL